MAQKIYLNDLNKRFANLTCFSINGYVYSTLLRIYIVFLHWL